MSESRYDSGARNSYNYGYRDSSESRSSESRKQTYKAPSESRNSESRTDYYRKPSENRRDISIKQSGPSDCVDAIDVLIDLYKAGKISGDNLADSLKKLNS